MKTTAIFIVSLDIYRPEKETERQTDRQLVTEAERSLVVVSWIMID